MIFLVLPLLTGANLRGINLSSLFSIPKEIVLFLAMGF